MISSIQSEGNLRKTPADRSREVRRAAQILGFDACGIAAATAADPENRLSRWLAQGYHADMTWMERTQELRQDVQRKLPGTRSVVVVVRNYYQADPAESPAPSLARGRVARYAWGRDYHRVLKKPLQGLAEAIAALEVDSCHYASIDSGPVLERTWAERAGLGWIGKNSLVLRRDLGSWFVLATILTTVELAPDAPMPDYCGTCTRCLEACPTQAIVAPKVVDARKCISYQTIENHGDVPEALQAAFGDWVFGCDICQEVCPWNRFDRESSEPDFQARPGQARPPLAELAETEEDAFRARFAGTPLMRAKVEGLRRNARIALRNLGRRRE